MSVFSSNVEHHCTPFALQNKSHLTTTATTTTRGPPQTRGQLENSRLEPENEYGNIEYKLRLTDPSPERIERLVTQLKWRIKEGHGEAILFLGVKDNGLLVGLTPEELRLSLQTLELMSTKIDAKMTVVAERVVESENLEESAVGPFPDTATMRNKRNRALQPKSRKDNSLNPLTANLNQPTAATAAINTELLPGKRRHLALAKGQRNSKPVVRKVIQVLVERKAYDIFEELRVAVLGPTESGKSSLLGVLSHGEHDNGRGSARLNLFRHRHEIRSGHTSSISQEILGFDSSGQPITYGTCLTPEEIIESSSKIVTLIDLAGHHRYLSTTLFGLGSHSPDVVLIVISANSPITSTITDHISIAIGIQRPLAIVINKIDLASQDDQEACYSSLVSALRKLHPELEFIRVPEMLSGACWSLQSGQDLKCLPIFFTSCITGSGMNSLYDFFYRTPPMLNSADLNFAVSRPLELIIDETFEVAGIGTVVSGLVTDGTIREGEEMLLGPDEKGSFSAVTIMSLQRHKIACNFARAGQKCTMAIVTKESEKVRRGMVIKEMDCDWPKTFSVCYEFEASIKFLTDRQLKLSCGSELSVYSGTVKQTCSVLNIKSCSTDNLWVVDLKLTRRPEYIKNGSRLIVRYADINGVGRVNYVSQMGSEK